MPSMIGYLAGDDSTYAVRSAQSNDIRTAVELPDHDALTTFCIMTNGDVLFSAGRLHSDELQMWHLGRFDLDDTGLFVPDMAIIPRDDPPDLRSV